MNTDSEAKNQILKMKACLKNECMSPNDLNQMAGPVYVLLFNL